MASMGVSLHKIYSSTYKGKTTKISEFGFIFPCMITNFSLLYFSIEDIGFL
jgi:hypothetical protein